MTDLERVTHAPIDTVDQANYFDLLIRQADLLAQSSIIPAAYRRKSHDIIAAGLAGRAFGWDVMTALRNYHVIEGTASLKPEAMLGLVRRFGHSVGLKIEATPDGKAGIAHGRRADNGDEHTAIFTTADAVTAGLAGKKNWKQYEDAMLTWRAVSALCRVLFPDVVMGAGYTPEEIGGTVTAALDAEDPLAEVVVTGIEAKRALLDACDGDKERARQIWGDRSSEPMKYEDLERLLAEVNTITISPEEDNYEDEF